MITERNPKVVTQILRPEQDGVEIEWEERAEGEQTEQSSKSEQQMYAADRNWICFCASVRRFVIQTDSHHSVHSRFVFVPSPLNLSFFLFSLGTD